MRVGLAISVAAFSIDDAKLITAGDDRLLCGHSFVYLISFRFVIVSSTSDGAILFKNANEYFDFIITIQLSPDGGSNF